MCFEEYSKISPIVAILRGITPPEMIDVCETLYEAGIRILEVPLNSPDACESIRIAAEKYHADGRLLVGAGTVLSIDDVQCVAKAGGKFIISPDTNPDVIRKEIEETVKACIKYGCPCEFVLKDISTVSGKPQNLITWAQTVSDVLDEYYDKA